MKITLKYVLVMMFLAPRAFVWGASDEATGSFNGLEADSTASLAVLIEILSEEEEKIGLTSERIEARVNQSLRKAGITPVPIRPEGGFRVSGGGPPEVNLYVNVGVFRGSFTISIEFQRSVLYRSHGKWFTKIGTTWDRGGGGIARDADYILDRIAEYVEVFCNEFLKANGK